jgi:hypothetical protein
MQVAKARLVTTAIVRERTVTVGKRSTLMPHLWTNDAQGPCRRCARFHKAKCTAEDAVSSPPTLPSSSASAPSCALALVVDQIGDLSFTK